MYYSFFQTDLYKVFIAGDEQNIKQITMRGEGTENYCPPPSWQNKTELFTEARQQLKEYLKGQRKSFDLNLSLKGTAFQKLVWNELLKIPYGETRCYSEIAAAIGHPSASRAVGGAAHANPIPIIIPCHRLIGKNGSLTGFALGTDLKRQLLELEKKSTTSPASYRFSGTAKAVRGM